MTAIKRFAARLAEHLKDGTRPPGKKTQYWGKQEFAKATGRGSGRTVTNWCDGNNLPPSPEPLESALFGKEPKNDDDAYRAWRSEFRKLFDAAAGEKAARLEKALLEKTRARQVGTASTEPCDLKLNLSTVSSNPVAAGVIKNVPRPPRFFLGRKGTVDEIHAILSDRTDRGGSVILYGLGGVGKTSLAAAYCQQHQKDYTNCIWIRAETNVTIDEDLKAIEWPSSAGGGSARDRLARADADTLLICDNAQNAELLRAHLPPYGRARILVTSNDYAWESVGTPIEIANWPSDVGADFLIRRSGKLDTPRDVAKKLSNELGGLPLAHEQAAAFCERLSISLAEYTDRFYRQPIKLLGDEKYAPVEHRRSVAKTFGIAIDAAVAIHPAAEQFILLVSLFGPNEVPLFMFEENFDLISDPLKSVIQKGDLEEVIAALRSFSLLEIEFSRATDNRGISYVSLHRLVRLVVLETRNLVSKEVTKDSSLKLLAGAIRSFSGVSEYTRNYGSGEADPPLAPKFRAVYNIVKDLVDSGDKEAEGRFSEFYMKMKFGPLYYRYD